MTLRIILILIYLLFTVNARYYLGQAILTDSTNPRFLSAVDNGTKTYLAVAGTVRTQIFSWNGSLFESLAIYDASSSLYWSANAQYFVRKRTFGFVVYGFNLNVPTQIGEIIGSFYDSRISGNGKVIVAVRYIQFGSKVFIYQNINSIISLKTTTGVFPGLFLAMEINYNGDLIILTLTPDVLLVFHYDSGTATINLAQNIRTKTQSSSIKILQQRNMVTFEGTNYRYILIFQILSDLTIKLKKEIFVENFSSFVPFNDMSGYIIHAVKDQIASVNNYQFGQSLDDSILVQQMSKQFNKTNTYKVELSPNNKFLFFIDHQNNIIVKFLCNKTVCLSCSAPMICQLCRSGFININGVCVCQTNLNRSISSSTELCISCKVQNCYQCGQIDNCTSCNDGYSLLHNNTCSVISDNPSFNDDIVFALIVVVIVLIITLIVGFIIVSFVFKYIFKNFSQKIAQSQRKVEQDSINLTNQNIISTMNRHIVHDKTFLAQQEKDIQDKTFMLRQLEVIQLS